MFKLFAKKEKKAKPAVKSPLYIYRPNESALSYRVSFKDDKAYVYPGWGKSFLYIIEGDKIFRAGEDKPFYIIIGKDVCEAAEGKPVYRMVSDALYIPGAREPRFVIKSSISVQGTL